MNALRLCPVSLAGANRFVAEYHRHHKPLRIYKVAVGCSDDGRLCGVAIVARPAAHALDDGATLDVARLCTDGTKNACSILYAAAWRAARAMGYTRMITYTLKSENGASLRASGWRCMGEAGCIARGGQREQQRNMGRNRLLFDDGVKTPRERKLRYEVSV
jgi:hypothetical protein